MIRPDHPEIGRELRVEDLKPPVIVVLQKEGRALATLWVVHVTEHFVTFHAGEIKVTFFATRLPDGRITDDSGLEMAMYEYLGKP